MSRKSPKLTAETPEGVNPPPAVPAPEPERRLGPEALADAMRLLVEGWTVTAVSKDLGITRHTVRAWRESPEGAAAYAEAKKARDAATQSAADEARQVLKAGAVIAAQALVAAAQRGPLAERIRAASTILDRVGVPRTERIESVEAPVDLSALSDDELAAYEKLSEKIRGGGG